MTVVKQVVSVLLRGFVVICNFLARALEVLRPPPSHIRSGSRFQFPGLNLDPREFQNLVGTSMSREQRCGVGLPWSLGFGLESESLLS